MWNWRNGTSNRHALGNYLANSLHAPFDASADSWLELAKIYRSAGRRIEYEVLAGKLKDSYGILLADWASTTQ